MIQTEKNTSEMHCYRTRCQTYRSEVNRSRGQGSRGQVGYPVQVLWESSCDVVTHAFDVLSSPVCVDVAPTEYSVSPTIQHRHRACQFTQPMSHFGIGWARRLHLTTPVAADATQPLSRWQNSAAVRGDAAVCWLVNSRWRLCLKNCNFVPFNIYCIVQLNENVTNFCFTLSVFCPFTCRKSTKSVVDSGSI